MRARWGVVVASKFNTLFVVMAIAFATTDTANEGGYKGLPGNILVWDSSVVFIGLRFPEGGSSCSALDFLESPVAHIIT
jgi:hypothetical protein